MRKYFLLFTAALALLVVSCKKETEGNISISNQKETHAISDKTPMAVVFTSKFPVVKSPDVATKGAGAIDDWGGGTKKPLYVYGFPTYRVDKGVKSYEWIDYTQATALIYNVAADQPNPDGDSEGVRLDGSQRSKINVYNAAAIGTGTADNPQGLAAQEPFYYKENQETSEPISYSFFGYYVDDAIANPVPAISNFDVANVPTYNADGSALTEPAADQFGRIKLTGLTLDGTQDIMIAHTDKEIDALSSSRYLDQAHYGTTELTADDLAEYVEPKLIYSSHAARRGINPDLIFEHQLSRITFYVKKGGTVPSSDLVIAGIDLFDYVEGDLTIAAGKNGTGKDATAAADKTGIEPKNGVSAIDWDFEDAWKEDLKDNPADASLLKFIKTVRTADDASKTLTEADEFHPTKEYQPFGQSVLVFSERQTLDMVLKIVQDRATAPGYRPYKTHLVIENAPDKNGMPVKFEAGKNYNVYLTVYGLEEVRLSVTLTEWDNARIDLDPDMDDDDMREPAQILLGTDRTTDPTGIVSAVDIPADVDGTPAAKDDAPYEDFTDDADVIANVYAHSTVLPTAELTIRECDVFDLLSTKMFVKGVDDGTGLGHTDIAGNNYTDADMEEDHYETVYAFVRSNSDGDFRFSLTSGTVNTNTNVSGILEYSNEYLTLTEDGVIIPNENIDFGTGNSVAATIVVRQNSSNDFLSAVPRTIALTIRKDDRVHVQINWLDKTGAAGKDPKITIMAEGGQAGSLDMDASFTIDYAKDGISTADDVTYVVNYENVNTPAEPVYGWNAVKKIDVTGPALSGPTSVTLDLEAADITAYKRFDLKFSVVKLKAGATEPYVLADYELDETTGVVRVDAKTGVIIALKEGSTKVLMEFGNIPNDDTYSPAWKVIDVDVIVPEATIGIPAAVEMKYGEKYTLKPAVSTGAGAVSFTSSDDTVADINEDGIILAKKVGTATITVTVADNEMYTTHSETCEVTVVKADPEIVVTSITIDGNGGTLDANTVITKVTPKYAAEGIVVIAGSTTYESTDTDKFTVDASGNVTGVNAGRATLKVTFNADESDLNYNKTVVPITVNVNPLANTFDLKEAATAKVDATGNGSTADVVYTTKVGDLAIVAVTKAGVPVSDYAAKFAINTTTKKIDVTGVTTVGDYVLSIRDAGNDYTLAATKDITLTVEFDDPAVDPATANTFDLIASTSLTLDDAGNGETAAVYTTANGDLSITNVTKGGTPVASFATKFILDTVNKTIELVGITESGVYTVTIYALGDATHVEATKSIDITVTVKEENNFDLIATSVVTVNANGNGITPAAVYTTAEGAVTITGVEDGAGNPVASFDTKFQLTPAKKILLTGVDVADDYVVTLNAAGDATHKAKDATITITVTLP